MINISIPSGKLKSPWMGVPVPGERPLILSTALVQAALRGVTVSDAEVTEAQRAGAGYQSREIVRALEVVYRHGRDGRGRGRVVFYDSCRDSASQREFSWRIVGEWARVQREKLAKPKVERGRGSGREEEIARQIKRLEKEKKRLYLPKNPPRHPLLPPEYSHGEPWREHSAQAEKRWHDEKPQRKRLARIAGDVIKARITHATGYKLLRAAGFEFVKFSGQPVRGGGRLTIRKPDTGGISRSSSAFLPC